MRQFDIAGNIKISFVPNESHAARGPKVNFLLLRVKLIVYRSFPASHAVIMAIETDIGIMIYQISFGHNA